MHAMLVFKHVKLLTDISFHNTILSEAVLLLNEMVREGLLLAYCHTKEHSNKG